MNDFRSYSNAKANESKPSSTPPNNAREGDAPLNDTVELAKLISKAMSGKSTGQIMQTIIAEAERGKRDGTLTNTDLDNFFNALSPLLDGAKKRKLKQVIENLKKI